MLLFDQDSGQPRRSLYGPSGPVGMPGQTLDEIAQDIEDAQRQQSDTMANIVARLRAIESVRPDAGRSEIGHPEIGRSDASRPAETHSASRTYMLLDEAGDEPWDTDAAEELMQRCEAAEREPAPAEAGMSYSQQAWIGERFNDVAQHITQALADLKPGRTVAMLEERLDAFQAQISTALADVARRADLEGIRLIEAHVSDLGHKLSELERYVSRIDGIESDMQTVMAQVSDERFAALLNADGRFTADLGAIARRAAEEVHARLGHEGAGRTDNQEELRRLIESSIADRRQADSQTVSLVNTLAGRLNAQSDRYEEVKGLIAQAIEERRQHEQTAFTMLDTLQQALVAVLDRMDALEQQPAPLASQPAHEPQHAPADVDESRPAHEPIVGPPPQDVRSTKAAEAAHAPLPDAEPAVPADAAYTFRDTRFDGVGAKDEPEQALPVEVPAAFSDPVGADAPLAPEETESPVDRLRRDFVADARRAKLKAAANRAEALGETEPPKPNSIAEARAAFAQAVRGPASGGSGRLFGMSTKLLAGVLALIIAINGGLLLINGKSGSRSNAPDMARPAATAPHDATGALSGPPTASDHESSGQPADAPAPGPRSDLGHDGAAAHVLYGFHDDVLDPPQIVPTDGGSASIIPLGMTIARPAATLADAAVAGVYEQQVLASLSGKLGMIAAGQSASAMLPDANGRIAAAYPTPDLDPASEAETGASSALDLPPATVGPMSLRLAAANGDPSAEFEVGARLAEGKGTSQDYADALRWYQRAAAKGFAQAQYRVGTLHERGLGVAKDLERAKVWYQRAAEGGNVKSMHNLAVLTAGGARPDYAAAMPWFLKAAEHGLADSQYNLGVLMENGLGGPTDRIAAYKWYALAATAGDGDATRRRDALATILNSDEIASADGMIAAFQARPSSPLANDPRTAGEDWKKRVNNDTNT